MNNSKLNYKLQAYTKEELIHLILGLNKRKPGWNGSNEMDIEKFLKSYDQNREVSKKENEYKLASANYNSWINRMRSKYCYNFTPDMLSAEELEEGARLEKKYKDCLRRGM